MIKKKTTVNTNRFRIGGNIRKWRNVKDIKQKDLANSLNLSEAAVSNIENDITNITVTQLEDIAIALNVSIEQLLSDPHEKIKNPFSAPTTSNQGPINHAETEIMNALLASLEKKDQQLQAIMQHFIHTITALMQHERPAFNGAQQVVSRL